MEYICDNIQTTRESIINSCRSALRPEDAVELMVVSKTFPVEMIEVAASTPHTLFGENKVQEAVSKIPLLSSHLRWHFIGHLQSNKVRKILPHVEAIHSVDSLELARDINRIAVELGCRPDIYLQVNIGEDKAKKGFNVESVKAVYEDILSLTRVNVVGLMTVPPLTENPADSRPYFAALRCLRDELTIRGGVPLPGLSMGMSRDLHYAICEGATIVRVGSSIFGQRSKKE